MKVKIKLALCKLERFVSIKLINTSAVLLLSLTFCNKAPNIQKSQLAMIIPDEEHIKCYCPNLDFSRPPTYDHGPAIFRDHLVGSYDVSWYSTKPIDRSCYDLRISIFIFHSHTSAKAIIGDWLKSANRIHRRTKDPKIALGDVTWISNNRGSSTLTCIRGNVCVKVTGKPLFLREEYLSRKVAKMVVEKVDKLFDPAKH